MKTAVLSFDQSKLCSLRKKDNSGNEIALDFGDALILQYLLEAQTWAKEKAIKDNQQFFHVNYSELIDDLPILGITNTKVLGRRIDKLVFLGLLEKVNVIGGSRKGTASYFSLTDTVSSLLFSSEKDSSQVTIIKIKKEPDKKTAFSFTANNKPGVTEKSSRTFESNLESKNEVTDKCLRETKSDFASMFEVTGKSSRTFESNLESKPGVTEKYLRELESNSESRKEFNCSEFILSSSSSLNLNTTTDSKTLSKLLKESINIVFGGLHYFSSDFAPKLLENLQKESVEPKYYTDYLIWCLEAAKKSVKSNDKLFSYLYKTCAEPSVIGNFKLIQKEKQKHKKPTFICPVCGTEHEYHQACPNCGLQFQDRGNIEQIELLKGIQALPEEEKKELERELDAITMKYDMTEIIRNPALAKEQSETRKQCYIKYGILKVNKELDIF